MASGGKQDFDDILVAISERTKQDAETDKLGKALKIPFPDIVSARVGNRHGETHMGTLDMLRAWRQGQHPSAEVDNMKDALRQANMKRLINEVFKEDYHADKDISSKKISNSLTVLQCREKLENVYKHTLCKIKMKPWHPNDYARLKDMHTRVTMVKKDSHGKNMKKTETLHASEIFSRKVNDQLPKRILLSAPAGRGKTTTVAKMAYNWTHRIQGSGLEDLPLLFVLRLRNTGQYTSIGEAIKSELLSDVSGITPEIIETFIRENQGICHIIFDGLDEYAGIGSGSNIVNIMRFEEYLDCRVLVTTRPHLENFFNEEKLAMAYTKMGIEGFSKEAITEYIDKFFVFNSNVSKGEGLKAYLESQPLINELVITPLFCLMVCHLWSEGLLTTDIGTQTKLLDSVNIFLLQYANARAHSKVKPKELKTIIYRLGKVALKGLLSDAKKLVFTPHDFRKVPTILESACDLGIISKTTVVSPHVPESDDTTQTTIEFYHKLAQEHSAGKYLAHKTKKDLVRIHMSKLDRVLRKIKGTIGDYENLIRFAAGTDNALCIIIMKALLTNGSLDESERYRILLDCSSETTPGTEGIVSSLVKRCVTSETMVLKSPTVFTVVGMQNLPHQLKTQVKHVHLEDSVITTNVTIGLWDCFGSFTTLHRLTISDSSLGFPPSPPELPHVTNLTAERVTSQSYEGLFPSLPGLREIDIIINDAGSDISPITAFFQRTGNEQLDRFILRALPSQRRSGHGSLHYKNDDQSSSLEIKHCLLSAEITDMLWSYFGSFTTLQRLIISDSSLSLPPSPPELPHVTRLDAERVTSPWSQSYEGLLSSLPDIREVIITINDAESDISQITAFFQRTGKKQLTCFILHALPSQRKRSGHVSLNYSRNDDPSSSLQIKHCLLSADITDTLWSYFGSFSTLCSLLISDSSLSFPSSPPELPHVTRLEAKRMTSQSYEGLLLSLPGLRVIDITIDDAERDMSQITGCLQRTRGEQLTYITLRAPWSLPSEKRMVSRETMRGLGLLIREQTKNLQKLFMQQVSCRDEEDWIDVVECCRHVKSMGEIKLWWCGTKRGGRLDSHLTAHQRSGDRITVVVWHDDDNFVKQHLYHICHAV